MNPAPAPEAADNTPWQRFDSAGRQILTVPKEVVIAKATKKAKP
jgi:hypothetical protein